MKTDVMQWVNSCSQCSRKKRRKPETEAGRSESLISPQIHEDVDRCVTVCMDTSGRLELCFILNFSFCLCLHVGSGRDDDDCSDEDEDGGGDVGEGAVSVADEERQPESPAVVVVSVSALTPSVDLSQIHLCHHVTQHISHVDPRRTLRPLSL